MTQSECAVTAREGPPDLAHLSYSSFTAWLKCGKAYELQKILGLQEQPAWWSIGGSAFHSATEEMDRLQYDLAGV